MSLLGWRPAGWATPDVESTIRMVSDASRTVETESKHAQCATDELRLQAIKFAMAETEALRKAADDGGV